MKPSLKALFSLVLIFGLSISAIAGKKTVLISCSEPDAAIFSNGVRVGTGQAEVIVLSKACVTINIKKTGFLEVEQKLCNKKDFPKPEKSYYFDLLTDPAYNASIQTDMANVDIEIELNQGRSEVDSWKIINQVITSYFDVIEISDRETGYLRTSWNQQSFSNATVRTRVIIKIGTLDPISYKVKLVSEIADAGTSVKADHKFSEWHRVLRSYETLVEQIVSRSK